MVGERTWLGLLPSEEKLLAHREKVVREGQEERGEGEGEGLLVYEDAPIMRPIVFLGPSSKDTEVHSLSRTCTPHPTQTLFSFSCYRPSFPVGCEPPFVLNQSFFLSCSLQTQS